MKLGLVQAGAWQRLYVQGSPKRRGLARRRVKCRNEEQDTISLRLLYSSQLQSYIRSGCWLAAVPEVLHGCCAVQHVPTGGKAAVQQQDVRQRRHHCRLGVETWQTAAEPRAIALQQQGFNVRSLFVGEIRRQTLLQAGQ